MEIITETLEFNRLKEMATNMFGDLVKAVVDIDRELVAVDGELHEIRKKIIEIIAKRIKR